MKTLLVMYVVFGGLLAVTAIPLWRGKVPPNPWYGFRVPSTLSNADIWYPVNRYMARWLFAAGLITVAGSIGFYLVPDLTVDEYAWLCLLVFAAPLVVGIVLSVRYLRRLTR